MGAPRPLAESLKQLRAELLPVPPSIQEALGSDAACQKMHDSLKALELHERAQVLSCVIEELCAFGGIFVWETFGGGREVMRHESVSPTFLASLVIRYALLDRELLDLVDALARAEPDERLTEPVGRIAFLYRELVASRWAVLMQAIDQELWGVEATRQLVDEILESLGLPTDAQHRDAFVAVHRRRPREWWTRGWLRAVYQARGDTRPSLHAWVAKAVRGSVADQNRRGRRPTPRPVDEQKLLALHAALGPTGLTERQVEVLYAEMLGETSAETGRRLGKSATTVRRLRQQAWGALRRQGVDLKAVREAVSR